MSGPGSVSGPAINTAGGPKCLAAAFQASGRPGGVVVGEKDQTALIRLIVIFSQGEASAGATAMGFAERPRLGVGLPLTLQATLSVWRLHSKRQAWRRRSG